MKQNEFVEKLIRIKQIADGETALISCQGQGVSGYEELANYRGLIEKFQENTAGGKNEQSQKRT